MFLHRPMNQAISIFFRGFEDQTSGIQEGGKRRDEGEEFIIRTKSIQKDPTIFHCIQDGLIGLFWETGHEEEVDPL